MVEAQREDPLRTRTPTQNGYPRFEKVKSPTPPTPRSGVYDLPRIATPVVASSHGATPPGDTYKSLPLVHGDETGDMPDSSMPDHPNPGSNRRRPRTQFPNPQRPPAQHPPQTQPPGHAFPPSSSEHVHNRPPAVFQGHLNPNSPYAQRPSFVGQYTMSGQPTPMSMGHTPTPYTFTPYHHQVVPDNAMISPTIHANYLQHPPTPVYPYQRHSPEGGPSSFSATRNPTLYAPHQVNTPSSPAPVHGPSSSGGASGSYVGSSTFQSLRYPSQMSSPPYPYATPSFSPSPQALFQSQYSLPTFGQHYTPAGEEQPQGTWYYLPHPVPSPQTYDTGQSYQPHYPGVTYPRIGDAEGVYTTDQSTPANPSSPTYPVSPAGQTYSLYSDGQASSDSPRASGAGPPLTVVPPSGSVSSSSGKPGDKPVVRRSYHPNPPAHRSEWVMWAGNVPSDATHDELWRFFNQPPDNRPDSDETGVMSIFLISRSSCAFVNYKSESFLHDAIQRFNGVPLRPDDPRCARLVCRVRRKDDDLKAGVGGQRGMGMHTRWIREQKGKQKELQTDKSDVSLSDDPSSLSPSSISERMAGAVSAVSISSDDEEPKVRRGVHAKHSSSSGSYTSTNSSFLTRHFPKRYFILKSLTQYDLDLSVERKLWATQKHNEEILNQAFRTSQEVYLIFGVNKSGEFYGYARMVGPVRRGEQRVSWASRPSQSPTSRSSHSSASGRGTTAAETYFSPSDHRLVDSSPLPVESAPTSSHVARHSAPALMGEGYHLPTMLTPAVKHSLDQRMRQSGRGAAIELDPNAPKRAMRHGAASAPEDKAGTHVKSSLQSVEEVEEKDTPVESKEGVWGDSFMVEWISTTRLPFHRTRHLRNPWNHDREVKVSRDGTELEPLVGERLLEEWEKLATSPTPGLTTTGPGRPTGRRAAGGKGSGIAGGDEESSSARHEDAEAKGGPSRS